MSDYLEKLKDPRWQKFKALVHIRDNWTCVQCGSQTKTLVAHHREYWGEPWEAPFSEVVTLCVDCHKEAHKNGLTVKSDRSMGTTSPMSMIEELQSFGAYPDVSPEGELWIRGSRNVPKPVIVRARRMSSEILDYIRSL